MIVAPDRVDKLARKEFRFLIKRITTFAYVPAVVTPSTNDVHLLPRVLPHVGEPQRTALPIETQLPRVPDSESPGLGKNVFSPDKRIVRRNPVLLSAFLAIHIDTNNRAEQGVRVLAMVVGIVGGTTVTKANVEISIWPELERATVVIPVGLGYLEENLFGARIPSAGVVFR